MGASLHVFETRTMSSTKAAGLILSLLALLGADAAPKEQREADLILTNGKIWTVNKGQPEAEALAIWHGRILAVGPNAAIRAIAGPATRVLDLKGQRVVPGFYDSH